MDLDLEESTSNVPDQGQVANRKGRGAIAAQACETCRTRKQKCDERRPRCSTCNKLNLECKYREPQPTKRDNTLVEILDRLKRVEYKIDGLTPDGSSILPAHGTLPAGEFPIPVPLVEDEEDPESVPSGSKTVRSSGGYQYVSSVSKMLEWPVIQQLLDTARYETSAPDDGDTTLRSGLYDSETPLPDDTVHPDDLSGRHSHHMSQQYGGSGPETRLPPPVINWETIQRLSKAYFDTFNLLYPILDRHNFNSSVANVVVKHGLPKSTGSTILLLVLALGDVAVAASGVPVSVRDGRPSGIKGGTADRPPGLVFFNEARKRMGFVLTEVTLENVQMFALAALYYESCGHSKEFWRMTMSASMAYQALMASKPDVLQEPHNDLIRRVFWHCSIIETCLHMEFGLPLTGLENMSDEIGIPNFGDSLSDEDYVCDETSHFQKQFASQIVLHRLLVGFHVALTSALGSISSPHTAGVPSTGSGPSAIKQLSGQLDQWRGMLPSPLQWHDESVPFPEHGAFGAVYAEQSPQRTPMFTSDLDEAVASLPFATDIQFALLRTKYYYSKYIIHRPYVFKALHHPDSLTREDAEGAAECLRSSLKWPIAMSPPRSNKRLIPVSFFWSQNLFGILVLLHLSRNNPLLSQIRTRLCGQRFDLDAMETIKLYIDWLRDIRQMDATAKSSWGIIKLLYGLED